MSQISIILPTYNVEKYIARALESCINQTFKDIEIIVVDDCGNDKSIDIAKEYASKDDRIKIIHNEENLKLLRARYEGAKVATSPYIIFLDSDDYWELNCIEECVPRMDGVDVVWFDSIEYHDIEKSYFKHHSRLKDINIKKECRINPIEWLKLLRQNKIKDFAFAWSGIIDFDYIKDKKMKFKDAIFAEDHLFGILLFSQAKNIYVYPKVFYYYRIRANSLTNQDKKITKDNILPYFKDIFIAFEENATLAKEYFKYVSWVETSLELVRFVENYHDKKISSLLKDTILYFYIKNAFKIKKFDKDPLCIKE
ncbi:TPA: glycosyltransferase family 2 protein, partial [Campylobacter jejuni]